MGLSEIALNTLTQAGWKLTPFQNSEEGQRIAEMQARVTHLSRSTAGQTSLKIVGSIATAFAGVFFPPIWIATPFLSFSAWKDMHTQSKLSECIDASGIAKSRLFYIYQTMSDIRSQCTSISTTEARSHMPKVTKALTTKWKQFNHLIDAFKGTCSQHDVRDFKTQKKAVIIALTQLQTASKGTIKGKKTPTQFETAKKAAITALTKFTEPANPRGILYRVAAAAESAIVRAQIDLNRALP